MTDRPGPKQRILAWTKERAPPVHTFLTKDEPPFGFLRGAAAVALFGALLVGLLWGGTGQPLGQAPVVVIETGSMMHCEEGVGTRSLDCGSTSFGRLGAIDPGDLVFVRHADSQGDIETFAEGGKTHHGEPGDVVVYRPGGRTDVTPVIHRAMFWMEIHDDGTFSIDELGIERSTETDHPAIRDAERFGLKGFCQLRLVDGAQSGWITKGDNNQCWDQTGNHGVSPGPVQPEWLLGKARGELPWIGLLKLFVFDFTAGTNNYENAPGDLKGFMWFTVGLIVVGPYAFEKVVERRRQGDAPHAADDESE